MPLTDDEIKQIEARNEAYKTTLKGLTWDEAQDALDTADADRERLLDHIAFQAARIAELQEEIYRLRGCRPEDVIGTVEFDFEKGTIRAVE